MTRQTAAGPLHPADVLRRHLRVNGLSHAADQPLVDAIAGAFAELHPEVALLTEATVVHIEPGDILVLTSDQALSDQDCEYIEQRAKARFPDNEIVVLERLSLAVVRPTSKEVPA